MLRILVIGGTRFLGQRLVEYLAAAGHEVTSISRRKQTIACNVKHLCDERELGLVRLRGEQFNLVIDFIGYTEADVLQVEENIKTQNYVLVSSTWLPRLWSGNCATELPSCCWQHANDLHEVTQNYLIGKLSAEFALHRLRDKGCNAVSLRLPIILGEGDHTGRLNFYLRRLLDDGPIIAIDGGNNIAQIALMENLAHAITSWCTTVDINRFLVWEALPGEGKSVREIIKGMAETLGVRVKFRDVSTDALSQKLPSYLAKEPFWRERSLPVTSANIFSAVKIKPAQFEKHIIKPHNIEKTADELRSFELKFLTGSQE